MELHECLQVWWPWYGQAHNWTQVSNSQQYLIFHDLRVTQVLYESSRWCCSHSSLPSHGLGPHAFLCSTESHIFLRVSSNSPTKCMLGKFIILNCGCECEWLVICLFEPFGGLANRSWRLWSFLWTFFIWRIRNFPWNLFTDKASTPSLRSSLFHIYGCSLPCIYSANHCWLTQKTLFLKYIFPICLHGDRDGRGHQLILLVKPGSDDMNEVWSATHRTRNGMLKILKNLIIWMSFRYNQTLKKD